MLVGLTVMGCDDVWAWVEQQTNAPDATESEDGAPPPKPVDRPKRPADSFAQTENEVITTTFKDVLNDEKLTRSQRIKAFENLDPSALQAPVAKSNVKAPPSKAGSRQRKQGEASGSGSAQDSRLGALSRRVPITMYSTSWCGVCKRARRYFQREGISFKEYDVDKDAQARDVYLQLNPRRSVPTITIGDQLMIGFSKQAFPDVLRGVAAAGNY